MIAGIGLDVVEVARVRDLIASRGDRALQRLFTESERQYCQAKAAPELHYAARLAAKEAAFKALSGTASAQAIGWREIEVRVDERGRPEVLLHERASKRAEELAVARVWVSLTHDSTIASAVVVLEADT